MQTRRMTCVVGMLVLAAAGTGASAAEAANGSRPRTPAVFLNASCLEVVDHDARSVVHLSIGIPFEDDVLTADELPDSRRFQFFALCRDQFVADPLPPWIDENDVERSLAAGLIDEAPLPEAVLARHPSWSDCAIPITAANDRMPIHCEATADGIDWDTSSLPIGNYVVRGYTFEPPTNLWVARPGVISIVRGDERPPVVALTSPARENVRTYRDPGIVVEGCMGGPPGTKVTLTWARIRDLEIDDPTDWHAFAEIDAAAGTLAEPFRPPAEAVNQAIAIAAEAVSPDGQRFVTYARGTLVVLDGAGEAGTAAAGSLPDACGVGEIETTDDLDPDVPPGCSCGPDTRDPPCLALGLVLWFRSRRGRSRTNVPYS